VPRPAVVCSCRLPRETVATSTGQRALRRHPPATRVGQAGLDYRTRAWAALRTAAAVLPSSLPSLQAQEDPPLQSHSYSNRLAESPHFHVLSHSEGAKRGSPAYKNHTTSQQLHSKRSPQTFERSTTESKHPYSPHTRQSLPLPKATRKAASHGCMQENCSPQPRTSCQICLASSLTCNFHRLLVVQAVVAASFGDLRSKGCLQKQVSEPACAQRSKKRTYDMMQKVNRHKVSAASTPVCAIPGPQPLHTTQQTAWS